jgi:hypothetical protein
MILFKEIWIGRESSHYLKTGNYIEISQLFLFFFIFLQIAADIFAQYFKIEH